MGRLVREPEAAIHSRPWREEDDRAWERLHADYHEARELAQRKQSEADELRSQVAGLSHQLAESQHELGKALRTQQAMEAEIAQNHACIQAMRDQIALARERQERE